ncbi:NUDIX hydrolase [Streptomyces sp. NPDC050504]|uniref:NUDIX hydrolase n=1 Tax=Streptomyces sp. NPDC050504 TaxID=3365618 RepID=UPI00378AD49F
MELPERSRVSAYAVATEDDRILLTRLNAASPVFEPGLWHLPGGGIDHGEQPREALARELYEETGLEVRTAELVDSRAYTVQRLGVHWHLVGLFYVVDLVPAPAFVARADDSTDEVAWQPLAGLPEAALSPAAIDALAMLGVRAAVR